MTIPPSIPTRSVFAAAAAAFRELVGRVGPDGWDEPGLGVWSVRDLVGHTSRSLTTIETYLGVPSPGEPLDGPVDYFRRARVALADPDAVAQRGRDAGAALGDDPAARVAELADRVTALVDASPGDESVGTPLGTMTLAGYLPTRVFELTVHGIDLARALDVDPPVTLGPGIGLSCALAGGLAADSPDAVAVLMALTGRTELPRGFTLL
ncbi:MAG: maleylpyruvate isomerase N-terminal domain-containing protein [Nocardioidaceae bacterium]